MTHTSTYTTVVPTGTLIPNQATVDGNVFAHDKDALAGLIVGVIAFVGLTAAWGFFAYRRHHVRRMQAEAAAAALGRSHGGPRALVLDEDDEDGGTAATRFNGVGPVSHPPSGGIVYDRIRGGNTLESPMGEDGGMSPIGDARSQDDAGGGVAALAPVPIVGMGEDASLMHPANRSAADVTLPVDPEADAEISVLPFPPPRQPMSPSRSLTSRPSSGPGPEPAEWLGGRAVSYNSLRNRASADRYRTEVPLPASPTSRTSRSSVYSDEVVSSPSHTAQPEPQMVATAATMATTGALGPAYTSKNASMSSHGHAGYMSSSSIHGHAGAGGGSSSGEHGSSSGHRTGTGSSSGHMLSSGMY
ncbi:hypothetical protein ONZ51_g5406 [Trametes cubensis]|uniref:Uncharacterized protein n=1 Tax=Trametes cubensis TaxID=1111947 RepID=A0AAD7X9F1_9APHY|nr:hypothetical protein ONZ51_g5406 [Trametes cubensis]